MHKLKIIFLAWLSFLVAVILLADLTGIGFYFGSDFSRVWEILQDYPVWLEDFTCLFLPSLISLALLGGLILVAARVRPAAALPEAGISLAHSRLKRRWIGLNGLAWLAAVSLQPATIVTNTIDLPLDLEMSGGWRTDELSLALTLFSTLAAVSVLAIAQWAALAGVLRQAGRWAAIAALGAGVGLVLLYEYSMVSMVAVDWLLHPYFTLNDVLQTDFVMFIVATLASLAVVYFGALFLGGAFAGWLQARLLTSPHRNRWWLASGLGMALGGLLGPFGGFVYGAVTAGRLQQMLILSNRKQEENYAIANS